MIYFIQSGRAPCVKIGHSGGDVRFRLGRLQIGNPEPLRVLATCDGERDDERAWHRRFAHLRIRGEWYRLEDDLRDAIGPHMVVEDERAVRVRAAMALLNA